MSGGWVKDHQEELLAAALIAGTVATAGAMAPAAAGAAGAGAAGAGAAGAAGAGAASEMALLGALEGAGAGAFTGGATAGGGLLAGGLGAGAAEELAGAGLLSAQAPAANQFSIAAGNAVTGMGGDYLGMMDALGKGGKAAKKFGKGMRLAQQSGLLGGTEPPPPQPAFQPGPVMNQGGASSPPFAQLFPTSVVDPETERRRRRMMAGGGYYG